MSLQAPSLPDLRQEVHNAARRARVASRVLALLPTVAKDQALRSAADAIAAHSDLILSANAEDLEDRKSTRLNSSHVEISYAVFCLNKNDARSSRYRSGR